MLPRHGLVEQAGAQVGQVADARMRDFSALLDRAPVTETVKLQRKGLDAGPVFLEGRNVRRLELGIGKLLLHITDDRGIHDLLRCKERAGTGICLISLEKFPVQPARMS
jgi:hypothetical protein